jgi:hypothetical protein
MDHAINRLHQRNVCLDACLEFAHLIYVVKRVVAFHLVIQTVVSGMIGECLANLFVPRFLPDQILDSEESFARLDTMSISLNILFCNCSGAKR